MDYFWNNDGIENGDLAHFLVQGDPGKCELGPLNNFVSTSWSKYQEIFSS